MTFKKYIKENEDAITKIIDTAKGLLGVILSKEDAEELLKILEQKDKELGTTGEAWVHPIFQDIIKEYYKNKKDKELENAERITGVQ